MPGGRPETLTARGRLVVPGGSSPAAVSSFLIEDTTSVVGMASDRAAAVVHSGPEISVPFAGPGALGEG